MKREDVLHHTILREPGLQTTADDIDKRRHTRFPVSVSADIIEARTRARVTGRASDLGVGGCYVDTLSTFVEGTQVEVFLRWQGRTIQLHALVSYAVSGRSIGMGLSFTGTSTDQGATLLEWVSGLGGEPARPAAAAPPTPQPQVVPPAETKLAKNNRLEEIIEELVLLLVRKQLITESESTQIRDRLSQ